jgi:hypothetical protein
MLGMLAMHIATRLYIANQRPPIASVQFYRLRARVRSAPKRAAILAIDRSLGIRLLLACWNTSRPPGRSTRKYFSAISPSRPLSRPPHPRHFTFRESAEAEISIRITSYFASQVGHRYGTLKLCVVFFAGMEDSDNWTPPHIILRIFVHYQTRMEAT